jgi:aarF domain-containing kinase
MAGKRLLDLAALFSASRGIAQKHVALGARRFDVYNKTSTLARAVRSQTDRVTETAKAATILASRLNENAPEWTKEASDTEVNGQSNSSGPIPSKKSTEGHEPPKRKEGLEQDHFYEKSESNSAIDPPPKDELNIQQESADRYPLPDGTIPPKESPINTPEIDADTKPTRSQVEPSQNPIDNEGLEPASSGASTIPVPSSKPLSSEHARHVQRESEQQIPSRSADALETSAKNPLEEGHDEDIFYDRPEHTSPTLSSLPRAKIPKHTSDVQENNNSLKQGEINSDSFYRDVETPTEKIPSVESVPEQDQVPEGINTELFYSPRVARILGGKTQRPMSYLELKGVKAAPVDKTKLASGRDQDTFNVRSSSENLPTSPEITSQAVPEPHKKDEDIEALAADISKESKDASVSRILPRPYMA